MSESAEAMQERANHLVDRWLAERAWRGRHPISVLFGDFCEWLDARDEVSDMSFAVALSRRVGVRIQTDNDGSWML